MLDARSLTSKTIKLLLLDKQHFFREGVRTILSADPCFRIQHEAQGLSDAIYSGPPPDVCIVDPFASEAAQKGLDTLSKLISLYPDARILVLSHLDSREVVQRCLSAGVSGYILKEASAEDLIAAIRKVANGEDYLHPSLGARLIRRIQTKPPYPDLTPTEKAMLRILAMGHTNAEAASILCYSIRTVEAYRSRLMKKLNLKNRSQMVKVAAELDLLHFKGSGESFSVEVDEAV